jgi:hypothetical protein
VGLLREQVLPLAAQPRELEPAAPQPELRLLAANSPSA